MFDIGAQEILLIVVVAILVIGPKDMPNALRMAGRWIGKMRKLSGHFRSGLDAMIREAEMEEMEKKWKAQNEQIMQKYPDGGPSEMEQTGAYPPRKPAVLPAAGSEAGAPASGASAEAGAARPSTGPAKGPDSVPPADDAEKKEG